MNSRILFTLLKSNFNSHRRLQKLVILFAILLSNSSLFAADANSTNDVTSQAISQAYRELASTPLFQIAEPTLDNVLAEANKADAANDADRAIGLLATNSTVIKANINNQLILDAVHLLVKYHATALADEIVELIDQRGNRYIIARCQLEYAKQYAQENRWDLVMLRLKSVDIQNELTKEYADEANILVGSALQHTKKHRQALEYYARVKPESKLYAIAQLNMALAYIRQDWWTDAQIAIKQSIQAAQGNDDELVNRLYSILGFSQLQQGFYRNARDNFRNVKIKSIYANRALLGIGMAALDQEDYVGALNAFNQLRIHPEQDMPVAQAQLLTAFTLTKVKQNKSAAASYSEAILYYDQLANTYGNVIHDIEAVDRSKPSNLITKIKAVTTGEDIELKALAQKLQQLSKLLSYALSSKTTAQLNNAYTSTFEQYLALAKSTAIERQTIFTSYLNQSRFGLTKLYDTP